MNYYAFHIGDYLSATSHLTLIEHGAYRRLLDIYYIHELPISNDRKAVYRLVGARVKEEKEAVDNVLEEFFDPSTEGWKHDRCEHEIRLCNKNRLNGKRGGRPTKNDNPNRTQTITQTEPKDNPNGKPPITPSPHHPITPFPNTQKDTHTFTDSTVKAMAEAASVCFSDAGIKGVSPSHPGLLALLNSGMSVEEFAEVAREAAKKNKGFAYALGIAETRRRDAAAATTIPPEVPKPKRICEVCGGEAIKRIGQSWYCADHHQYSERVAA